MKYKISKYKIEKTIDREVEIDIPEKPEYHFQTGIRRSIAIIPIWTTWQKEYDNKEEEIWKLKFISVYQSWENKIEMDEIQVSRLSEISMDKRSDNVFDFFLYSRNEYTKRTEERFMIDYNQVINNFNEQLNLFSTLQECIHSSLR